MSLKTLNKLQAALSDQEENNTRYNRALSYYAAVLTSNVLREEDFETFATLVGKCQCASWQLQFEIRNTTAQIKALEEQLKPDTKEETGDENNSDNGDQD